MNIILIDYGMGNHLSVQNALQRLGHKADISRDPQRILAADGLILPGVGSFNRAMQNMHGYGLVEPLREAVLGQGTPLLGICLGMQLLGRNSTEGGESQGLGLIDNPIRRLPQSGNIRIPHVGFNEVYWQEPQPLMAGIRQRSDFYFTHSFAMQKEDNDARYIYCDYGQTFVCGFSKDNISGVQFHPEKSQRTGLHLIQNFLEVSYA